MEKRVLIWSLIAIMLLALAGCGEKDVHRAPKDTETDPTVASGEGDAGKNDTSIDDTDRDDPYKLPAGASSEYELYAAVLAYLNNGFRAEDLKNVCDPVLTMAFFSKWEEHEEDIFTLGLNCQESCDLIAALKAKAAQMDPPYDEDGELEEDLIDFDAFEDVFPEELRGQLESNRGDFENFIVDIFYMDADFLRDGENPFYTEQTEWEVKREGEYEVREYHSNDWCDDLYDNFPKAYELALGTYFSDYDATEMWYYFTEIEGRYYLLSFGRALGGIGG